VLRLSYLNCGGCPRTLSMCFGALLVAALMCLPGCEDRKNKTSTEEENAGKVRLGPEAGRPQLDFPKALKSTDPSLNDFIETFYSTCCKGEYDKFRLMLSTRVDPLAPERFKKSLTAVERVQIEAVEKLPDVAEVPPPIYLVRSRIRLREGTRTDRRDRSISILVFREGTKWVMAPAPKNLRQELDVLTSPEDAEEARPNEAPAEEEKPQG